MLFHRAPGPGLPVRCPGNIVGRMAGLALCTLDKYHVGCRQIPPPPAGAFDAAPTLKVLHEAQSKLYAHEGKGGLLEMALVVSRSPADLRRRTTTLRRRGFVHKTPNSREHPPRSTPSEAGQI